MLSTVLTHMTEHLGQPCSKPPRMENGRFQRFEKEAPGGIGFSILAPAWLVVTVIRRLGAVPDSIAGRTRGFHGTRSDFVEVTQGVISCTNYR